MISGLAFLLMMGCIALAYPFSSAAWQNPTAVNRVTSVPASPPVLTVTVSLPAEFEFCDDEEEEDLHAARVAAPTGHAIQPATAIQQPAKFPDNNTYPDPPADGSSNNKKMLVTIISASTGGVVVLGAVALFVWHTHHHHRRNRDPLFSITAEGEHDTISHNISKFPEPPTRSPYSPRASYSSSRDNSTSDIDGASNQSPRLSMDGEKNAPPEEDGSSAIIEQQQQQQQKRLSTIIEEKDHGIYKPPAKDSKDKILEEMTNVVEEFASTENPDKIIEISDRPVMRSISYNGRDDSAGPRNNISIKTTYSLNNSTHKLIRYPPLVRRDADQHLDQQQQKQFSTSISSPSVLSHSAGASNLTFPLRKIIYQPSHLSTQGRKKRQHLEEGSQQGQPEEVPFTPLGMPATQFVPLQNSPFQFVPRLSIMLDPEKRQGIHEVPDDTAK